MAFLYTSRFLNWAKTRIGIEQVNRSPCLIAWSLGSREEEAPRGGLLLTKQLSLERTWSLKLLCDGMVSGRGHRDPEGGTMHVVSGCLIIQIRSITS